jgi:hypothetical protein
MQGKPGQAAEANQLLQSLEALLSGRFVFETDSEAF